MGLFRSFTRVLVSSLVAGLIASLGTAIPAGAEVTPGVTINNPLAGPKRQFVILRQVNTAIRHAHPGNAGRSGS